MTTQTQDKQIERIRKDLIILFDNAFSDGEDGRKLREKNLAEIYADEALKTISQQVSNAEERGYKKGFDAYAKKESEDWKKAMRITKEQTGLEGGHLKSTKGK